MLRKAKRKILKSASIVEQRRTDWVKEELLKLPKGLRILDAGAGEMPFKQYCKGQTYVSQDFGLYDGVGDKTGLQTGSWDQAGIDIVSDIAAIPVPDESFDVIICTEVLEHLPDPLLALKEFQRILAKGGILLMTAPFYSATHFAPYHFFSGFSRYFYREHLNRLGFRILELRASGNFSEAVAQQLVLTPAIARKRLGRLPSFLAWLFIVPLLWLLSFYSRKYPESSELFCFGWFVKAIKQ